MDERYLVRCSADTLGCYIGRFATQKTTNHRINLSSTIREEEATRYDSEMDAASTAHRLAGKFSGTTWKVCHVA